MKKNVLIYFDLITSLKTTQEVTSFVSEIDTLLRTSFKSEKISTEKALDLISEGSARKIIQAFSKNNLDINDRDTVVNFFETLKGLTNKFKVIKLVLAFDPPRKTIEKIHNFVTDILGVGYILDIEISQDLLGGAVVMFNGQYHDFTLKENIEDAFNNRGEEIVRTLNS